MEQEDTQSEEQQEEQQEKHPGGRPLKFETVKELDQAIRSYFDSCDPHVEPRVVDGGINQKGETIWLKREVLTEQKPYTMSGLARALGTTRETILDYGSGRYDDRDTSTEDARKFSDSVADAKSRCEEFAESQLFGPFANGAKFNLTNNYQGKYKPWAERQEIDHTTKGKSMQPKVVSEITPRAPTETEATPSNTTDQQPAD